MKYSKTQKLLIIRVMLSTHIMVSIKAQIQIILSFDI